MKKWGKKENEGVINIRMQPGGFVMEVAPPLGITTVPQSSSAALIRSRGS